MLAVQLAATIADMTSKLSRVAVFISMLRLEELDEARPFVGALNRIEDDAEHGLYGILCRLHIIHQFASNQHETTDDGSLNLAAVDAVQLTGTSRRTDRHLITFSIISDLAKLLQHSFDVLRIYLITVR